MHRDNHPAPAPETTRDTTPGPRTPQLKKSNFSQEQLSSAAKDDDDKPLEGDWDVISLSSGMAGIPHAGAGQHQPQLPRPPVPDAASNALTTKALEKLQAMLAPVLGRSNNVGRWAQSQSSHGDSLNAARPQEGIPPRGHSKSSSSSRLSTNPSEGFAPAEPPNQVEMDLVGAGSMFDEPTPLAATRPSLEEFNLQAKKAPGTRTGKSHK